ncbi:MAG: hypothetical protein H6811_11365 [Phycisphaeraceae bacterium]|nr:hypothetical protein [Phycisphaeraceae bacterium]
MGSQFRNNSIIAMGLFLVGAVAPGRLDDTRVKSPAFSQVFVSLDEVSENERTVMVTLLIRGEDLAATTTVAQTLPPSVFTTASANAFLEIRGLSGGASHIKSVRSADRNDVDHVTPNIPSSERIGLVFGQYVFRLKMEYLKDVDNGWNADDVVFIRLATWNLNIQKTREIDPNFPDVKLSEDPRVLGQGS